MPISFSTYDVSYNLSDESKITAWIREVVENKGVSVGDLNYIFCSEDYILEINTKYLSHNYPTDIISFDYSTRQKISGDILICISVVEENAKQFDVSFFNELLRVIIHGVLHFLGYKDSADNEKSEMRRCEDLSLLLFDTTYR